jgi:hypothetical protein
MHIVRHNKGKGGLGKQSVPKVTAYTATHIYIYIYFLYSISQLMRLKMNKNYTLHYKGKKIHTHSYRAFLSEIRRLKFLESKSKAYLRVSYGQQIDNNGRHFTAYNDGHYNNKSELMFALRCFNE